MCEYSGRLVAWLDGELAEEEATNVEWHLGQCAECRVVVSAYEEVSGAFLSCYESTLACAPRRSLRWMGAIVAGAAAAAVILLAIVLWPQRAERLQLLPPLVAPAPAMAFVRPSVKVADVPVSHVRPARQVWISLEPTVEVALPADAFFPPGAVPEGFSFIADVRTEP
jgi:anti-sigma factor RsiW